MTTSTYEITGMTCSHCVAAVTEEVTALAGVTGVSVDLPTGRLTLTSDRDVPGNDVADAVSEAGYTVVGR